MSAPEEGQPQPPAAALPSGLLAASGGGGGATTTYTAELVGLTQPRELDAEIYARILASADPARVHGAKR